MAESSKYIRRKGDPRLRKYLITVPGGKSKRRKSKIRKAVKARPKKGVIRKDRKMAKSSRKGGTRPVWMPPEVKDGDVKGLNAAINAAEQALAQERTRGGFGTRSMRIEGELRLLRQRKEQALQKPSATETYSKVMQTLVATMSGLGLGHLLANAVDKRHVNAVKLSNNEVKALASHSTNIMERLQKGHITPVLAKNALDSSKQAANMSQITQKRGMDPKQRYAMSKGPMGWLGGLFLIGAGIGSRYFANDLSDDKAEQSAIRTAATVEMMTGAGLLGTRLLQTQTPAAMLDTKSIAKVTAGGKHDVTALQAFTNSGAAKAATRSGKRLGLKQEARQLGIDSKKIHGSGKGGRVTNADLSRVIKNKTHVPVARPKPVIRPATGTALVAQGASKGAVKTLPSITAASAWASRYLPVAGHVASRAALPLAAAMAAYQVGKGAYDGYQKGGVSGAAKGGAMGAADFLTFGAASWAMARAAGSTAKGHLNQVAKQKVENVPGATLALPAPNPARQARQSGKTSYTTKDGKTVQVTPAQAAAYRKRRK